jgi:hypothetical protein
MRIGAFALTTYASWMAAVWLDWAAAMFDVRSATRDDVPDGDGPA